MTGPDRFRTLIGAYLIGMLEPEERADLEGHLRSCRECQEELTFLAPLPAILRRLASPSLLGATEGGAGAQRAALGAAAQLNLAALVRRATRRRRKTMAALGAAVAGAAAVAVIVTALLVPKTAAPSGKVVAMRGPVASGTAVLESKAWGTQIVLHARRLPSGALLVATVYGPSGQSPAGSWSAPADGRAIVELATSLKPPSIRRLVVVTGSTGGIVLHS